MGLMGLILLPACTTWAGPFPVEDYRGVEQEEKAATENKDATKAQPAAPKKFNVTMEAALPAGFPDPGPVGKVIIKTYPVSRRAVVDRSAGRNFNRLFNHIKKNKVAMTTPVTMDMQKNEETGKHQAHNMAFYYEAPQQGKTGEDGQVKVEDLPSMKVVSVGMAGALTREYMSESRSKLEAYLKEKNLKATGELRILAYNSPFVPYWKKYYEMQIPVEIIEQKSATTQPADGSE